MRLHEQNFTGAARRHLERQSRDPRGGTFKANSTGSLDYRSG